MTDNKKIMVLTSTFPKNDKDEVPSFVKDQIVNLSKEYKFLDFTVIAPETNFGTSDKIEASDYFNEVRYHYFWPRRFEILIGKGIIPTIKKNKFAFLLVPFYFLSQLFVSYRVAKKIKPDIFYAHWFTPQGITAYLLSIFTGKPFVFTTHAQDVIILRKIPIIGKFIAKKAISKSSAWTCDSKSTELRLIKTIGETNFEASKSLSIPMAVDSETYDSYTDLQYKEYENLNDNFNILFLGRFAEIKGVDHLLKLFQLINTKYPNVNLILGGDGNLLNEYKNQIKKLNINEENITFTGYVDKRLKTYLFEKADLFILPSILSSTGHKEGLPVVLLESLYFGKLIMASKYCNAEEVIEDKKSGFLFDPLNTKDSFNIFEEIYLSDDEVLKEVKRQSLETGKKYSSDYLNKVYYEHLFKDFI